MDVERESVSEERWEDTWSIPGELTDGERDSQVPPAAQAANAACQKERRQEQKLIGSAGRKSALVWL